MQYLVLLGGSVNIFGSLIYIRDTITGRTKPNRITWFLWSTAPLIGAAAAFSKGAGWAAFPVFAAGLSPLLIFISSFFNKKSYWKLTTLDYLCGILSAFALVLWLITREPLVAIIFAVTSDMLAAFPTLVKSFKFPETESGITYLTGLFNALTSFFVIRLWNPIECIFPVYLVAICTVLSLAIYHRRIRAVISS